jgi:hypothetical protein
VVLGLLQRWWMSKSILASLVLLVSCPLNAFADQISSTTKTFPITVRDSSGNASPSALSEVLIWIESVKRVLTNFDLPPELRVQLGSLVGSSADAESNAIDYEWNEGALPKEIDPVFVHEFGHIVFGQPSNLEQILPSCLALSEDREELYKIGRQLNAILSKATLNEYMQLGVGSLAALEKVCC